MIDVLINNETDYSVPETTMAEAVRHVLQDHDIIYGEVSLAVVNDSTMQQLNRRHLQHDYPTDVLSFLLDRQQGTLEGEVIVSVETAARASRDYGWAPDEELLLYVVHGTLHLVGYDDRSLADRRVMRDKEVHYLSKVGVRMPSAARLSPQPLSGGDDSWREGCGRD